MSGSRSSKAAITARVDIVFRLLLLGLDRQKIIDHVRKKYRTWPQSTSAIDRYIAKANELLIEAGENDRPLEFGRSLARRHDLYLKAYQKGDYRTADAIQDRIDTLLGLKAPVVVNIVQLRQQLVDLMTEEVWSEAAEITRGAAQAD